MQDTSDPDRGAVGGSTDDSQNETAADESITFDPDNHAMFEVDIVVRFWVFNHRMRILPNVHAVLALSAVIIMVVLIYTEMVNHGEATLLLIAEIAHFAGWVYLEFPEAFLIEVVGE